MSRTSTLSASSRPGGVAEVVEEAVEAGVAAAGEAGGLAGERAVGVALGRVEVAQVLLDGREVAARDRSGERVGRARRRTRSAPTTSTSGANASNGTPQLAASRSTWPSSATRWFEATTAAAW